MNANLNAPDGTLGLKAIKSDGTIVPLNADGTVTLADATTYYIPIGTQNAALPSIAALVAIHLAWAAALRAVITVELCIFPATKGGSNPDAAADVSDFDATAGNWIPVGAGGARVVDVVAATATGMSVGTITAAGGAFFTLPDLGARRLRVKVAVTAGAALRALPRGKVG